MPGLPTTFPPLRSLDAYRSNLPYELSSFIGRDEELRAIAERLGTSRVVSIVGVGGVGKTRLALQIASELLPRYPDGVWLCELASVHDAGSVVDAIASAVGYAPPQGVPVAEGLPQFLERKALLVVLDNCEHLLAAVARWVTATTTSAAKVSVLVTSREALGVRGEQLWPLASLGLPGASDAASVAGSEAGALFSARAAGARGSFVVDDTNAAPVGELCSRLDGIPLAIELAAAQTMVMSPAEIVRRLDRQFRLLGGGRHASLERHQTLRAAIDWSYDLLAENEQTLLNRLSVCTSGFDLDAAVALAAGFGVDEFDALELLASLVAKSLVEHSEREGITRYRMLEMIRQYAAERLNGAGDSEAARDDHVRHYLATARDLFAQTATPADYEALSRIEIETPNIAAAGRWLLVTDRAAELLAFFDQLPFLDWFAWPPATIDDLGTIASDAVERTALTTAGREAGCNVAAARAFLMGELAEYRRLGESAQQGGGDAPRAGTSIMVATSAMFDGDLGRLLSSTRAAVERARVDGDPAQLAWMLGYLAISEAMAGTERALAAADEALDAARRTGSDIVLLYALNGRVTMYQLTANFREQRGPAQELLRADRTQRGTFTNIALMCLGSASMMLGEVAVGIEQFREVVSVLDHSGGRSVLSLTIASFASAIAAIDPIAAIDLALLSESDAIAAYSAFAVLPPLAELAATRPTAIAEARAKTDMAAFGYEDAVAFVHATLDRLLEVHGQLDAPDVGR